MGERRVIHHDRSDEYQRERLADLVPAFEGLHP